jgi:septum site-determining protein MinC
MASRTHHARPQVRACDRHLNMAAIPDYEQAGELKIGQVGIANLRIRTLDIEKISAEMRERVRSAPNLFRSAAIILDFGGLSDCPDAGAVRELIDGLRAADVLPVGIAYGTSAIDALSKQVGLPLLAKFRAPTSLPRQVHQPAKPERPIRPTKPLQCKAVPTSQPPLKPRPQRQPKPRVWRRRCRE